MSRPSAVSRRLAAAGALACLGAIVVATVVFLVRHPAMLVLGLGGCAAMAAGAWSVVLGRGRRRLVGIGLAALGAACVVAAVVVVVEGAPGVVLRVGAIVVLAAAGTALAGRATEVAVPTGMFSPHPHPERPVLFANPHSGDGKVGELGIVEAARSLGVQVVELGENDDLAALVAEAVGAGADCLGMAGGDGSLGIVAGAAAEAGLPFVCVPAGTKNHLAMDLRLDRDDPAAALEAFVAGWQRRIDLVTVTAGDGTTHTVCNNASLGAYAEAVQSDDYRDDKVGTFLGVLPAALEEPGAPFDLRVTLPDGTHLAGALVVLVANNAYVLDPTDLARRPRLDAGELALVAVDAADTTELAALMARAVLGVRHRSPHWHECTATELVVDSDDDTVALGVDGEALRLEPPLTFEIHPRVLAVLVPPSNRDAVRHQRARDVRPTDLVRLALGRRL